MIEDPNQASHVAGLIAEDTKSAQVISAVIGSGIFRPCQLLALFDSIGVKLTCSGQEAIDNIMAISTESPMAVYGSGYWADHWEYYLDLIEAYTSIYPDGDEGIMYDTELQYFFSIASVEARSDNYIVDYTFDGKSKHILQLDATKIDTDKVILGDGVRCIVGSIIIKTWYLYRLSVSTEMCTARLWRTTRHDHRNRLKLPHK